LGFDWARNAGGLRGFAAAAVDHMGTVPRDALRRERHVHKVSTDAKCKINVAAAVSVTSNVDGTSIRVDANLLPPSDWEITLLRRN
jgi:hypothetical protein